MTLEKNLRLFSLLLLAGVAAWYGRRYFGLPAHPAENSLLSSAISWAAVVVPPVEDWAVLRRATLASAVGLSPLAQRFRLAGTFFAFAGDDEVVADARLAVLDDLQRKQQFLLRENEALDDVQVVRILQDRVVLRAGGQQEELWLSFHGGAEERERVVPGPVAPQEASPPLEVNRFGKRVGETRWVISREALLKYYEELKEDPERVAKLYMTMKPDYRDNMIAGYTVDIEGEAEFLAAVGLRQNDIIRKVNSMKMTSQRRAEYFISEFLQNRVSAVVLDIERDNQPQKLVYLIR